MGKLYHATTKITKLDQASIEVLARPEQPDQVQVGIGGAGGEGTADLKIKLTRDELAMVGVSLMDAAKCLGWDKEGVYEN